MEPLSQTLFAVPRYFELSVTLIFGLVIRVRVTESQLYLILISIIDSIQGIFVHEQDGSSRLGGTKRLSGCKQTGQDLRLWVDATRR